MGNSAGIGGALALTAGLLAGCTSEDEPPAPPATTSTDVVTDHQPDEPELTPGQDESPEPIPGQDGAASALSTASDSLGGQAFQLDRDDDEDLWDVSVAVGDEKVEISVSLDGSMLVRQNAAESLDDDDRRRLDEAAVAASEAAAVAAREHGAAVQELELDDDDGTLVWDIELQSTDGASIDVRVDAVTGEVL